MKDLKHASWFSRGLSGLLRLFFRLLYHEFAWTYDWVAAIVSVGNWEKWVLAVLPFLENGPVLEIGHGPGRLQAALSERASEIYGLDASPQMGRIATRRLRKAGLTPRLLRARSQELPFSNRTFSTIVSTFPTEYIFDAQTLQEIWRALVPGGRLVVLPFAWITGRRPSERATAWLFQVTSQSTRFPAPHGNGCMSEFEIEDQAELEPWFHHFTQPARQVGFQINAKILSLGNSAILILIADKQAVP